MVINLTTCLLCFLSLNKPRCCPPALPLLSQLLPPTATGTPQVLQSSPNTTTSSIPATRWLLTVYREKRGQQVPGVSNCSVSSCLASAPFQVLASPSTCVPLMRSLSETSPVLLKGLLDKLQSPSKASRKKAEILELAYSKYPQGIWRQRSGRSPLRLWSFKSLSRLWSFKTKWKRGRQKFT